MAVAHPAGIALVAPMVEAVAQLGGRPVLHVHGAHVRRVVLDGQHAQLVEVRHARERTPVVERARRRVGLEIVGDLVGSLDQPARVVRLERLRAAHDAHRLEPLLPHDGAAPVLGGDVPVVALDGGEAHEVLAGRTDRVDGHAMAREPMLLLERLLGLPGVEALERRGVADLDRVVVDVEVRERLRLALDHDGVVARVLERGAEEAVGLGRGGAVGERPARHHREPARAPDGKSGKRPRGQDEPVVGMVPVDLGPHLVVEDLGAQPDAAETVAHLFGAPGLGRDLPGGEVHAEKLPRVAARPLRLRGCFLRGTLSPLP